MRHVLKLVLVLSLSVVGFGCGGDDNVTPDAGKAPDAGPTCPAAQKCGSLCCDTDQKCLGGDCVTCGCDGRVCGTDECNDPCGNLGGLCPAGQKCNPAGQCVPDCATPLCGGQCCGANQTCVNNVCTPCNTLVCGGVCCAAGEICQNNQCKPPCTNVECNGVCCQPGQICQAGQCYTCPGVVCAGVCCGAGQTCQNSQCTGQCATPLCGGVCCPQADMICIAGQCVVPDACNNTCTGATPVCDAATATCKCQATPTDSCGGTQQCINGACCVTPCDGVCCGAGQVCTAGQCTGACTGVTCGTTCCAPGQTCDANNQCHTPDACGDTCQGDTPVCDPVSLSCKCNSTSCTDGKACVNGECVEPTCNPQCEGTTPWCDPATWSCKCRSTPTDTCGMNQHCVNGTCQWTCSGTVCGTDCCEPNESCLNNSICCVSANSCGNDCCEAGEVCNFETLTCEGGCSGIPCGSGCCVGGEVCLTPSNTCCPAARACGSVCCGTGQHCDTETNQCVTAQTCNPSCDPAGETPWCDTSGTTPTCKCTANSCTGGKVCNASGQCVVATCNPPCGQGTTCNPENNKCECSWYPDSCAKATGGQFMCDPDSTSATYLTCISSTVTCGSQTCARGQACVVVGAIGQEDPANPGYYLDPYRASGTKSCSCVPTGYSASHVLDSCESAGKICDDSSFDPDNPTAMACRDPGDREDCLVGISTCIGTGITCETLTAGGGTFDLCIQKCTSSAGCPHLTDNCQTVGGQQACWSNICAEPWTIDWENDVGTENPSERSKYYLPCNAAGTNDGYCVPSYQQGYNAAGQYQYVDVGICVQTGTAAANGICNPEATRANLNLACGMNQSCEEVQQIGTAAPQGICRASCNAAPGPNPVKGCGAGQTCVESQYDSIGWIADYYCANVGAGYCGWLQAARLGYCETSCNVTGPNTCTGQDALGNNQGCEWIGATLDDPAGYCKAVSTSALPPHGQGCGDLDYDGRKACTGNAVCLSGGSFTICLTLCNTATCTPSTTTGASNVCSSCVPSTDRCYGFCATTGSDQYSTCTTNEDCCSGTCNTGTGYCVGAVYNGPGLGYCLGQ